MKQTRSQSKFVAMDEFQHQFNNKKN